ncbi:hypothetical protein M422DRAFT_229434 [Sphaerobolus stellatus SS14]|uniref:AB hydrolase-1 domain-containing protein n=1 Tax=Sphaerobolus stellatus (strain SS14) TaxID=990650 RepID=A0A0C9VUK5_SPHS4|nr:hypothetical protein M422DRAFT_229434 [Sphaerobolus stellatus SS14]
MNGTSVVQYNTVDVGGVDVFYRSAGASTALMTILLLHGFPASSFQFRNLIPLLAPKYRAIAPDLPGFGFTNVPQALNYNYNFDNLANTTQAFVNALGLKQFAVYIFDYEAPVGFRLATSKPDQISAIISQSGNAYVEGLVLSFWDLFEAYWNSSSVFDPTLSSPQAQNMLPFLSENVTQFQYTAGVPKAKLPRIDPAAYTLDSSLLQRVDQNITQLSLFFDYQTNVALYPVWHQYFRTKNPRVLALWGKNDPVFGPAGAEGFKKDLKNVEVGFVDTGHFALETDVEVYAARIDTFLQSVVKSG